MRTLIVVLACVGLAACAGKDGATGPTGPQGATGPQGPAGVNGLPGPAGAAGTARYTAVVAIASTGSAVAALPSAIGTDINKPPAVACYTGSTTSTVWLSVAGSASGSFDTYCGLVFSNGAWSAVMNRGISGWLAAFVVIY